MSDRTTHGLNECVKITSKTKFHVARINKCNTHSKHGHHIIVVFFSIYRDIFHFFTQEFCPPLSMWNTKHFEII